MNAGSSFFGSCSVGRRTLCGAGLLMVLFGQSGRLVAAEDAAGAADKGATPSSPATEGPPTAETLAVQAAAKAAAEVEARDRVEREQQARDLAALRAEVNALRAQLDADQKARTDAEAALAAQVQAAQAQANQAPPQVSTARPGVSLTGYLQADWVVHNQSSQDQLSSSGAPLNQDEIFIRRARLRAAIDRWWVAGLIEFDGNTVNGTQARLIGAEASVKWPPERGNPLPILMATVGLFKIPFGYEVGQSDRERLFLERSTAEHGLFPGEYDAGLRLMGGWRFVRYVFAVMDGEPIGEKSSDALHDPNRNKDFVGRLGVDTPLSDTVWFAGGFSGLSGTGFHAGTAATKSTVQWVDRNGDGVFNNINELIVVPGVAAQPSANFSRFGYGADLRLGVNEPSVGATVLYGEVYWAQNLDRGNPPRRSGHLRPQLPRARRLCGFHAGLRPAR